MTNMEKNMENMKNLEKSKEKEFTERAKRIQSTISLLKSLACVLAVMPQCLCFFMCGTITIIMLEASL